MKRILLYSVTFAISIVIIISSCTGGGGTVSSVTLRSEPASLDRDAILESIKTKNLYCPGENINGKLILKNRFEAAEVQGSRIVNDHVTNLMWQRDEDPTRFNWKEAQAYVAKINEEEFAGYNDWRIPTTEELVSLLTPKKVDGKFINPLFNKELLFTWTSDELEDMILSAWFIDFDQGKPSDGNRAAGAGQIRLVRTL